jgi:hypothetical protein
MTCMDSDLLTYSGPGQDDVHRPHLHELMRAGRRQKLSKMSKLKLLWPVCFINEVTSELILVCYQ